MPENKDLLNVTDLVLPLLHPNWQDLLKAYLKSHELPGDYRLECKLIEHAPVDPGIPVMKDV